MILYVYDGSFEGLLSAVFQIYIDRVLPQERPSPESRGFSPTDSSPTDLLTTRGYPLNIVCENRLQLGLLDEIRPVATNEAWAERVLSALNQHTEGRAGLVAYKMFLSEQPQGETAILRFIRTLLKNPQADTLGNYANPWVADALRIEKMINREVHRMHAFVRFQKSAEGIYYAAINPDFNVLPLIGEHFAKRYADQLWIILDTQRHYALYYDLDAVRFIAPDDPLLAQPLSGPKDKRQDENEDLYQDLWVSYFNSVNIKERKNTKLHLRHMPKRYWRFLIEKSRPTPPIANKEYLRL